MKIEKRAGTYFVAKNREIFGPISTSELEGMKKSGQLANYSWICKDGDTAWSAIDPAPDTMPFDLMTEAHTEQPVPAPQVHVPAHATAKKIAPAPRPFQVRDTHIDTGKSESFRGILFDSRNAVTAWVSEASADGCEIRSDGENTDPLFVHGAGAVLNLYEVATGKTSNVPVHVDEILRMEKHWVYRVRWSHVPALFEEQKAS
jgi:hypothetical protein